jgi:hypothetical protein
MKPQQINNHRQNSQYQTPLTNNYFAMQNSQP